MANFIIKMKYTENWTFDLNCCIIIMTSIKILIIYIEIGQIEIRTYMSIYTLIYISDELFYCLTDRCS